MEAGGVSPETLQWLVRQGGLVIAIVVILYFYRRDFKDEARRSDAMNTELLTVIRANVSAMSTMESTSSRLSHSIDQLADAVRERRA